jgi:hypothetical protein
MRRLMTYLNSLLLGVILGMIFLATIHASSSPRKEKDCAGGIAIAYEFLGANNQKTVLLIAGTKIHLVEWPALFCEYSVDHEYRVSSSALTISASLVRPTRRQQTCALRK